MEEPPYNSEYSSALFVGENYQKKVGEMGIKTNTTQRTKNCVGCALKVGLSWNGRSVKRNENHKTRETAQICLRKLRMRMARGKEKL